MQYQRAVLPMKIDGLSAARSFFASCFLDSDPRHESLFVAHVDNEARCLHVARYEGDETGADFPLRQIIADAAVHGSAGLVLAHNHPSGDASPSPSDCKATRRLAVAAEALDCTILDHLVFAGQDCTSLRGIGLL
jgi:DNA repair protein RadC